MVRERMGATGVKPTPVDYAKALEQAIVEVLGHEAGHIGPERPIAPGAAPFLGDLRPRRRPRRRSGGFISRRS